MAGGAIGPDRCVEAHSVHQNFSAALQANGRETAVKQALQQLLSDFLSAILFLVVYVNAPEDRTVSDVTKV